MKTFTLFIGADQTLDFQVPGIPPNVTVAKAYLTAKQALSDLDVDALFTKTIETPANNNGRIVNAGENGVAKLRFQIEPEDVANADFRKVYAYQIKLILSNSLTFTSNDLTGTIKIRPAGISQTS